MPVTTNFAIPYPDGTTSLTPLQDKFADIANAVDAAMFTGLAGAPRLASSDAQRATLFPAPAQGNLVNRPDKGYIEGYYALFDPTTNPGGAPIAGWYPVAKRLTGLNPIIPVSVVGGTVSSGGMVTFSASGSVSLNGVFSSLFENYLLYINTTAKSAGSNIALRLRSAGADDSTNNYSIQRTYSTSTTTTSGYTTSTSAELEAGTQAVSSIKADIISPAVAFATRIIASGSSSSTNGATIYNHSLGGFHNVATSFDSCTLFPTSGTITGTARLYGYNNN